MGKDKKQQAMAMEEGVGNTGRYEESKEGK